MMTVYSSKIQKEFNQALGKGKEKETFNHSLENKEI